MLLNVKGADVFVATSGKAFDASLPTVVFLHGAGMDHTAWAQHDRWFAHHGYNVLAPDLPGHGRSAGALLPSIGEMADWTAALIDASGAKQARLIGHSMGSLIALETAARHPEKVSSLVLVGTSSAMAVGPDLLKAAEANDHSAIDVVSIWGLGQAAGLGGRLAPPGIPPPRARCTGPRSGAGQNRRPRPPPSPPIPPTVPAGVCPRDCGCMAARSAC